MRVALLLLLTFSPALRAGDFRALAPSAVGSLLSDHGLKTRAYRLHDGDTLYRASTPYKEIGAAYPLPNNLAYYISGEAKQVTQLKLVLNLNAPTESTEALSTLAAAAVSLMRAALDEPPTDDVIAAIRKSASGEWNTKDRNIRIRRIDWTTSKGYELQLTIE